MLRLPTYLHGIHHRTSPLHQLHIHSSSTHLSYLLIWIHLAPLGTVSGTSHSLHDAIWGHTSHFADKRPAYGHLLLNLPANIPKRTPLHQFGILFYNLLRHHCPVSSPTCTVRGLLSYHTHNNFIPRVILQSHNTFFPCSYDTALQIHNYTTPLHTIVSPPVPYHK